MLANQGVGADAVCGNIMICALGHCRPCFNAMRPAGRAAQRQLVSLPNLIRARAATTVLLVSSVWLACRASENTVAFVGCVSDGQTGPLPAPSGRPVALPDTSGPASEIAYYRAEHGPGVFAPRGWHCRGWYGSSGDGLLVAPEAVDMGQAVVPRIAGPGVEMSESFGGTSGRFGVAVLAATLFPQRLQGFVKRVRVTALAGFRSPVSDSPAIQSARSTT
jgi:hypothetical protein